MDGAVTTVERPTLLERAPDLAAALEALAALLGYPSAETTGWARVAAAAVASAAPDAEEPLARFVAWLESTTVSAQEETYARTFDWSPTRGLEIGWHLHGETYDRGAFLVAMRDVLRRAGLSEGGDLPDHLRLVLAAVARRPVEETEPLVESSVAPALDKILHGFGEEANPYADLVRAADATVRVFRGRFAAPALVRQPPNLPDEELGEGGR